MNNKIIDIATVVYDQNDNETTQKLLKMFEDGWEINNYCAYPLTTAAGFRPYHSFVLVKRSKKNDNSKPEQK